MLDNYENIFSLYETIVPTNEDIIVAILPPLDILRYDYVLEKDGEIILTNSITGNQASNVILEETGIYSIKLTLFDNRNVSHVVYSGNYKIDKEKPIINLSNTLVNIKTCTIFISKFCKSYSHSGITTNFPSSSIIRFCYTQSFTCIF